MKKAEMRKLSPGFYDDGAGTIHVDLPELLEHLGLPNTPLGRDIAAVALRDAAEQLGLPASVVEP